MYSMYIFKCTKSIVGLFFVAERVPHLLVENSPSISLSLVSDNIRKLNLKRFIKVG